MSSANRTRSSGFTLIEMLVVLTVIAILAAVIAPSIFRNVGDAKSAAAKSQMQIFELALDAYRLDNDYYPSTVQGLSALVQSQSGNPPSPRWRGPYLKRDIPQDPWGRAYVYRSPGTTSPDGYDLLSLGRDGTPGGSGEDADISLGTGRR